MGTLYTILIIYGIIGFFLGINTIRKTKEKMTPPQMALSVLVAIFMWGYFFVTAFKHMKK